MDCLLAVFPTHRPTHSAFAQSGAPAPCHLWTAGGSQSGRKKARSLCTQSPLWQPRACSHDAWGQRGFRLHSRPTAQPICSKSCPFLIVGLPHPEDIRVRACFWIIFFVFLIYFFVFWGFRVLSKGFDEMSFQFGIICPIFPSFSCELGSFVACSCFSEVFPLCLFFSISRHFLLCFGVSIWHYAFGTLFSGQRFHMSHEKYPFTFHYTGCLIGALTMAYYN